MKKKSLVLIHGFLSGPEYWFKQEVLSESFNLIKVTLPGFSGRSEDKHVSSIKEYVDDVINQINDKGVDDFYLLGHSMGGMIAQELVFQYPERVTKLVLYGTGPLGQLPGRFESLQTSIATHSTAIYKEKIRNAVYSWFYNKDSLDIEDSLHLADKVTFETYLAGLKAMDGWSGVSSLESISQPTLIIWGDSDQSYIWHQISLLWDKIPNASLSVIPQAAHNLHIDDPASFNSVLLNYLVED